MEKLKVLLITGFITKEHYPDINLRLVELLQSTGRFEVKVTEEFRGATDETLAGYDAVFINYDGKHWPTDKAQRWGETAENTLFRFVRGGGGAVVYHSSIWVDDHWPQEYRDMLGMYARMAAGSRRCPNPDEFVVDLAEDGGPITDGLAPRHFVAPGDDFFAGLQTAPGADVKVLATSYDDVEPYRLANFPPPHHPVEIPNGDLNQMPGVNTHTPVVWTNRFGQGRVFVTSVGHEIDTLRRPVFLALLCRGAEWAATGEVTLNAPDRSGENRLNRWPYYKG